MMAVACATAAAAAAAAEEEQEEDAASTWQTSSNRESVIWGLGCWCIAGALCDPFLSTRVAATRG
jgi:hypothetical protein